MKERFEWIQSWQDEADKTDLPRILLIGDSITRGYQDKVRDMFRSKFYVDYLATSYAIDSDLYMNLITSFITESRYHIIHFNYGLHGKLISEEVYENQVNLIIKKIKSVSPYSKVVLALTTSVCCENVNKYDETWEDIISKRNYILKRIAEDNGFLMNDLYKISIDMAYENRLADGFHYTDQGYSKLADNVVKTITDSI